MLKDFVDYLEIMDGYKMIWMKIMLDEDKDWHMFFLAKINVGYFRWSSYIRKFNLSNKVKWYIKSK